MRPYIPNPNKKPDNIPSRPRRIQYKVYKIGVTKTDSFIKNRTRFRHSIIQYNKLDKNAISLIKEQNIRKVSQKINNSFFNSRKFYLNFKSDLNFFRKVAMLDKKFYYTKKELDAMDYFHGTGFYKQTLGSKSKT